MPDDSLRTYIRTYVLLYVQTEERFHYKLITVATNLSDSRARNDDARRVVGPCFRPAMTRQALLMETVL